MTSFSPSRRRSTLLAASAALAATAAQVYHASIASTLDQLMISTKAGQPYTPTEADQNTAVEFALFAGRTWTPPTERPGVTAALTRLKDRVTKATLPNDVTAVAKISGAITAVGEQPDKLPSQANGGAPHDKAHSGVSERTAASRR